jgi:hypothetical protein
MSNAADTAQAADQEEAARGLAPKKKPCWPDDPNYPDGYTEIDLPSERLLRAYFDTQILEESDEPQPQIIHADDYFKVRFRLELKGELWYWSRSHPAPSRSSTAAPSTGAPPRSSCTAAASRPRSSASTTWGPSSSTRPTSTRTDRPPTVGGSTS